MNQLSMNILKINIPATVTYEISWIDISLSVKLINIQNVKS